MHDTLRKMLMGGPFMSELGVLKLMWMEYWEWFYRSGRCVYWKDTEWGPVEERYCGGKRHGPARAWRPDGRLHWIQDYFKGYRLITYRWDKRGKLEEIMMGTPSGDSMILKINNESYCPQFEEFTFYARGMLRELYTIGKRGFTWHPHNLEGLREDAENIDWGGKFSDGFCMV